MRDVERLRLVGSIIEDTSIQQSIIPALLVSNLLLCERERERENGLALNREPSVGYRPIVTPIVSSANDTGNEESRVERRVRSGDEGGVPRSLSSASSMNKFGALKVGRSASRPPSSSSYSSSELKPSNCGKNDGCSAKRPVLALKRAPGLVAASLSGPGLEAFREKEREGVLAGETPGDCARDSRMLTAPVGLVRSSLLLVVLLLVVVVVAVVAVVVVAVVLPLLELMELEEMAESSRSNASSQPGIGSPCCFAYWCCASAWHTSSCPCAIDTWTALPLAPVICVSAP